MKTYDLNYFIEKGRKGGLTTSKKYSKRTRQKWGRLGGQNNKKPKPKKKNVDNSENALVNTSV